MTCTGSVKILPGRNTDLPTFRLPKITLGSAHHGQNAYEPKVQAVQILTRPKPIRRSKYLWAQIVKILGAQSAKHLWAESAKYLRAHMKILTGPTCKLPTGPICKILAGPICKMLMGPNCKILTGPICKILTEASLHNMCINNCSHWPKSEHKRSTTNELAK